MSEKPQDLGLGAFWIFKYFESNSQHSSNGNVKSNNCFKEQRYKIYDENNRIIDVLLLGALARLHTYFKRLFQSFFKKTSSPIAFSTTNSYLCTLISKPKEKKLIH